MADAIIDYGVALSGTSRLSFDLTIAGTANEAAGGDWSPSAGEVKISKDCGAEANIATLPAFVNGKWRLSLSAAEAQVSNELVISIRSGAVNFRTLIYQADKSSLARWKTDFGKGD